MFDWLKEILGESYTEEIDKKVSEKVGKDFVSKADFNKLNDTKKELETQIITRDKQLEGLKEADVDGLKTQIETLQRENKDAQETFDKQMERVKFDNYLENALLTTRPKNVKSVKALLELDELKLEGDKILGLDTQLEKIKSEHDYLFEQDKKSPKFGDSTPGSESLTITGDDFKKMGYKERVDLKQKEPETYKTLTENQKGS